MNRLQQIILLAGLLAITGFCLRPPYQWERTTYRSNRDSGAVQRAETSVTYLGHCWIWRPPQNWTTGYISGISMSPQQKTTYVAAIDWPRLGVYVGLVAAFCLFVAIVIFKKAPQ